MKDFVLDVSVAIDMAAMEVAKIVSDAYGVDFNSTKRNVSSMIKAAVSTSTKTEEWMDGARNVDPWLVSAVDMGDSGMDKEKLSSAIEEWWKTLDDKGKLSVIFGPAGHHDSEYMNNIRQKYQDKPEGILAREIPELHKHYRPGVQAPAAPPADVHAPEPAPVAPLAPGHPEGA